MAKNYYSRFLVIRLLSGISSETIYNHFTSVPAEYGYLQLSLLILVLSISVRISKIIVQRKELQSQSVYHTTTKQIVLVRGQLESLWKKVVESNKYPVCTEFSSGSRKVGCQPIMLAKFPTKMHENEKI